MHWRRPRPTGYRDYARKGHTGRGAGRGAGARRHRVQSPGRHRPLRMRKVEIVRRLSVIASAMSEAEDWPDTMLPTALVLCDIALALGVEPDEAMRILGPVAAARV